MVLILASGWLADVNVAEDVEGLAWERVLTVWGTMAGSEPGNGLSFREFAYTTSSTHLAAAYGRSA